MCRRVDGSVRLIHGLSAGAQVVPAPSTSGPQTANRLFGEFSTAAGQVIHIGTPLPGWFQTVLLFRAIPPVAATIQR